MRANHKNSKVSKIQRSPTDYGDRHTAKELKAVLFTRWSFHFADRIQWVFPSLFIPSPYRKLFRRGIRKVWSFYNTKHMNMGRYTPFRPWVRYEWGLEKTTNQRIAIWGKGMSRWEKEAGKYYLEKSVLET